MNERIQELMWDAGLNSNYVEGFDSIYSEQLNKFAGLIIQECVTNILKSIQNTDHSDLVYNAMLTAIVSDIHESFGITSKQETFSQAIKDAFKDGVDLSGYKTP